jgi:hypothetical protein
MGHGNRPEPRALPSADEVNQEMEVEQKNTPQRTESSSCSDLQRLNPSGLASSNVRLDHAHTRTERPPRELA